MAVNVLVTGGLGFVGSAVVDRLLKSGHDVTVFDDRSRGSAENVDVDRIVLFDGDIRNLESLVECVHLGHFDAVIHLAAMHFLPQCNLDPQGCILTNVVGTENMLSACSIGEVPRIIAASSMAVYPISDNACREEDQVGPYDVYGETKLANEMQLRRWSRQSGGTAVAIRLSNAYGPRETNPHVIPEIMRQLIEGNIELDLGNTRPFRDYIHVDDIAAALERLLVSPLDIDFHVYNLGSGKEHNIDEILTCLGSILDLQIGVRSNPAKVRKIERLHLLPDIRKIAASVGWAPDVGFREGLEDLCHWYGLL